MSDQNTGTDSEQPFICTIPKKAMLQFQDDDGKVLLTADLLEIRLTIESSGVSDKFSGEENIVKYQHAFKDKFKVDLTPTQIWAVVTTSFEKFEGLKKKYSLSQPSATSFQELPQTG